MAAALIGNIMVSNIRTNISATTATGVTSGANQVLASNILANPTLGSGNYTYQWSQSGTTIITFTAATSNSTNCTYGSLSVAGSTTIFCTVTDTWTGVKSVTSNCVITWPIQTIPITAVTWSIGGATNSVYTGSPQSVTVVSVTPPGAIYSTATTTATNAGGVASTTITGTNIYTGSFTSPNLTISAAQLTISAFNQFDCDGNENGYYTVSISGIQGTDTVSLEVWIGDINVGPQSVAPVLPFAIGFYNGVTSPGPNPRNITNADLVGGNYYNGGNGLVLKKNDGDTGGSGTTFYWIILNGLNANYISSGYIGPRGNYCGG